MFIPPADRVCLNLFSGPGGMEYIRAAGWRSTDFVEYDRRLNGFPDTHVFRGPMVSMYRQVLDSVMPPVAYALGALFNQYFEAIEDLLPQPRSLGYRYVVTERNRRMAPSSDGLLHGPRRRQPDVVGGVEPLQAGLAQAPLL